MVPKKQIPLIKHQIIKLIEVTFEKKFLDNDCIF